jgi:hypothetical protein
MDITVTITRRDLAGMMFRLARETTVSKLLFAVVFVIVVKTITSSGRDVTLALLASYVMTGVLFGIAAVYANAALTAVGCVLRTRRTLGVLGEHLYSISETGLREKTDVNDSTYAWPSVTNVVVAAHALILRAGTGYHLIPSRAFPTKEAFRDFCNAITRYSAGA